MKSKLSESRTLAAIAATVVGASANEIKSEPKTVKLFVHEVPITVLGDGEGKPLTNQKEFKVTARKIRRFHVELVNQLPVPTSIHWHGLILPNLWMECLLDAGTLSSRRFYNISLKQRGLTGCIPLGCRAAHFGAYDHSNAGPIQSGRCHPPSQATSLYQSPGHPQSLTANMSGMHGKAPESEKRRIRWILFIVQQGLNLSKRLHASDQRTGARYRR